MRMWGHSGLPRIWEHLSRQFKTHSPDISMEQTQPMIWSTWSTLLMTLSSGTLSSSFSQSTMNPQTCPTHPQSTLNFTTTRTVSQTLRPRGLTALQCMSWTMVRSSNWTHVLRTITRTRIEFHPPFALTPHLWSISKSWLTEEMWTKSVSPSMTTRQM